MAIRDVASFAELQTLVGTEVAITAYVLVDQARIDEFARVTRDHQWIHVDAERAQRESPFGQTIAHGFLTLSLVAHFLGEAVHMGGARLVLSSALNTVRFMSPIPAGSRIRARVRLRECSETPAHVEATWRFTIERENERLPVCVADWTVRYIA